MSKDHDDGLKAAVAALKALKSKPGRKTKRANGDLTLSFSARPMSISPRWLWKPISMREA